MKLQHHVYAINLITPHDLEKHGDGHVRRLSQPLCVDVYYIIFCLHEAIYNISRCVLHAYSHQLVQLKVMTVCQFMTVHKCRSLISNIRCQKVRKTRGFCNNDRVTNGKWFPCKMPPMQTRLPTWKMNAFSVRVLPDSLSGFSYKSLFFFSAIRLSFHFLSIIGFSCFFFFPFNFILLT